MSLSFESHDLCNFMTKQLGVEIENYVTKLHDGDFRYFWIEFYLHLTTFIQNIIKMIQTFYASLFG